VTILSAVVVTSLHAQDFCDVVGDLAMGRTTLPILYPTASRLITCATVVVWSVVLPVYWHAGPAAAGALLSAGAFVAWRFWHLRTAAADRRSYVYYNVRAFAVVCERGLTGRGSYGLRGRSCSRRVCGGGACSLHDPRAPRPI
jgi:hypothetical protein